MALNAIGVALSVMSVFFSAVVAADGKPTKALVVLGMFGGMALAAFAINVFHLPRWARERGRQMETIADHAVKLLSNPNP